MLNILNFDYLKYQEYIKKLDGEILSIESHNNKWDLPSGKSKYHFHLSMGPCPFEGNLLSAKIILLLANPGFNRKQNPPPSEQDHKPRDGWGIANLSPEGLSNWYRPRFKTLINQQSEEDWQRLSNKMAMIQVIPWASESYIDLKLPSRLLMSETVKLISEKNQGAIFIVMRRRKDWEKSLENIDPARVIFNPNPRCSFITRGNFKDDWQRIKDKLNE